MPLEQAKVLKAGNHCDQTIATHFQTKPVLNFTFAKENAQLARSFMEQLDQHAEEYGFTEAKDFHDQRFPEPIESRNAYLNHWKINLSEYQTERRTLMR